MSDLFPEAFTLRRLMEMRSKHSDYQILHPHLCTLLGDQAQPVGKHEAQRQRYMAKHLPLSGLSVLDIGANTGYFSFAAMGVCRSCSQPRG